MNVRLDIRANELSVKVAWAPSPMKLEGEIKEWLAQNPERQVHCIDFQAAREGYCALITYRGK